MIDMEALFRVWSRNAVAKYKIAQNCRKLAAEIDTSAHPALRDAWRLLLNIADEFEAGA